MDRIFCTGIQEIIQVKPNWLLAISRKPNLDVKCRPRVSLWPVHRPSDPVHQRPHIALARHKMKLVEFDGAQSTGQRDEKLKQVGLANAHARETEMADPRETDGVEYAVQGSVAVPAVHIIIDNKDVGPQVQVFQSLAIRGIAQGALQKALAQDSAWAGSVVMVIGGEQIQM